MKKSWIMIVLICIAFPNLCLAAANTAAVKQAGLELTWVYDTGAELSYITSNTAESPKAAISGVKIDSKGNAIFAARVNDEYVTIQSLSTAGAVNWKTEIFHQSANAGYGGSKLVSYSGMALSGDGNVYFYGSGSSMYVPPYTVLYAINSQTGEIAWTKQLAQLCSASLRKYSGLNLFCRKDESADLNLPTRVTMLDSGGTEQDSVTVAGSAQGSGFNAIASFLYTEATGAGFRWGDKRPEIGSFVVMTDKLFEVYDENGNLYISVNYNDLDEDKEYEKNYSPDYYVLSDYSALLKFKKRLLFLNNEGVPVWSRERTAQDNILSTPTGLYSYTMQSISKIDKSDGNDAETYSTADSSLLNPFYSIKERFSTNLADNDYIFVSLGNKRIVSGNKTSFTESSDALHMLVLNPETLQPVTKFPYFYSAESDDRIVSPFAAANDRLQQGKASRHNNGPAAIDFKRNYVYTIELIGNMKAEGSAETIMVSKMPNVGSLSQ